MKLIMDFIQAFGGRDKAMNKAFERVGEGEECVICYEAFKIGQKCVVCGNVFHHGCLVIAVDVSKKCPMCRAEVDLEI